MLPFAPSIVLIQRAILKPFIVRPDPQGQDNLILMFYLNIVTSKSIICSLTLKGLKKILKRKPNKNKPTGSPSSWWGDGTVEGEGVLLSVSWYTPARRENGGRSWERRALFWALGYSILIRENKQTVLVILYCNYMKWLLSSDYFSSCAVDKFLSAYITNKH